MWEFLVEYFWNPIYSGVGYNVYNTAVYAVLALIGIWACDKLLKKIKVKVDKDFLLAVVPYAVLGALLRVLQDFNAATDVGKSFWLVTPGIYLLMAGLAFGTLLCFRNAKAWGKAGWVYSCVVGVWLFLLGTNTWQFQGVILILILASLASFVMAYVMKVFNFYSPENLVIAWAHALDGFATAIAISHYGYFEQHVVTSIITNTNPWIFPIVKCCLILIVLHTLGKKSYGLKSAVLVLGLAPGLRDAIRLLIGV